MKCQMKSYTLKEKKEILSTEDFRNLFVELHCDNEAVEFYESRFNVIGNTGHFCDKCLKLAKVIDTLHDPNT